MNWENALSYALASPTATWQVYNEPTNSYNFFGFNLWTDDELHFPYFLCSPSPSPRHHCCCLTPFKTKHQPTCCIFCKSRIAPCCRHVLLFLLCFPRLLLYSDYLVLPFFALRVLVCSQPPILTRFLDFKRSYLWKPLSQSICCWAPARTIM